MKVFIIITICMYFCTVNGTPYSNDCEYYYNLHALHLDCAGRGLKELPNDLDDQIEGLDLSNNLFTTIPIQIKSLSLLTRLNMSQNEVNIIGMDVLSNLTFLEVLDLSQNKISSLADISANILLANTKNIKKLILSRNPLSKFSNLNNNEILVSESLEVLDMSKCSITSIEGKTVVGLTNLNTLILKYNPLRKVRIISRTLQKLDISHCQLSSFHPDSLNFLPILTHLQMSHNNRLDISSKYSYLSSNSLTFVDISFCNMPRITLSNLPNIETLNLKGNMIRRLSGGDFFNNSKLFNLDISSNAIEIIHHGAFFGLNSLKFLNLSINVISKIHIETFTSTPNITTLILSRNYITSIQTLKSLSLNNLDVSMNEIQQIDPQSFFNLPYLVNINLGRNLIGNIPDGLESDSLQQLDLSFNRISDINNSTFQLLPSLIVLYLSGNRFTVTWKAEYFASNTKLLELFIDDNTWRCDCFDGDMKAFFNFATGNPSKVWDIDSLMCHTPTNVSGLNWLKACSYMWYPQTAGTTSPALNFMIAILTAFFVCFLILFVVKRSLRIKMVAEEEERQRRAVEGRERLRLLHERSEQQAALNAPDPRDLVSPPSYAEALLMPPLQGSFHSLSDIPNAQRKNKRNRRRTKSSGDLLEENGNNAEQDRRKRKHKTRRTSESEEVRSQSTSNIDNTQTVETNVVVNHTVEFHESDF